MAYGRAYPFNMLIEKTKNVLYRAYSVGIVLFLSCYTIAPIWMLHLGVKMHSYFSNHLNNSAYIIYLRKKNFIFDTVRLFNFLLNLFEDPVLGLNQI